MTNRFFRLPFAFDPDRLRQDLACCSDRSWSSHVNVSDYTGTWTSLSLRSVSGLETDSRAHDEPKGYSDTFLMDLCPYLRQIVNSFKVEKQAVRLLSLAPDSIIREHTDQQTGYEYGCFRLHIPLQTGSNVSFRVDGVDLPMQVGECWYANFHLPHSVRNDGPIDRVHLILDGLRNDWSDELFGRAGYDFSQERRSLDTSLKTKQRMIAELTRMQSDTAKQLIAQLRLEIDTLTSSQL